MIRYKGKNSNEVEQIIEVLLRSTTEKGLDYSEANNIYLHELQCSFDKKLRPGFAISALQELVKADKSDLQSFINFYCQKAEKANENLVSKDWQLFIPINIKPNKKRVSFSKAEVFFFTKSTIKKKIIDKNFLNTRSFFGKEEVKKLSSQQVLSSFTGYCISINCKGNDIYDAWSNAEEYYDLIRGILEFILPSTSIFHPVFKKRAKIGDPKIIIGSNSKDEWHFFKPISDTDHPYADLKLTKDQNILFTKITNLLSKKGLKLKSFNALIADSLRLYSKALDSIYDYDCLLSLWQMCERITCANNFNGKTDDIVKRLSWHSERLGLAGSGFRESLSIIAATRNDIVHRGFTYVDTSEIDTLQVVAKSTLRWLFSLTKEIETEQQLEDFYKMRTLSKSDLNSKKSVISLIEKKRKNNQ